MSRLGNKRVARPLKVMAFLAATLLVLPMGSPDLANAAGNQMCTMEYAPVCGKRGSRTQTFANACQAGANGYRITGRGECPQASQIRACTREYAPVCARSKGRVKTFGNACMAKSDDYRIIHRGPCR
ncbi:Kazal-type serine protease inhibitor domain-containing protein [Pararhizobium sp.]|uniref:Kazal-type serine protease inhibitor domain-containing protein n=1 Tax=Pararhizobium sp. TaxID=1977563 RepID=UPI00271D6BF6|nr:Kazal-type serine protease inhibitor domain-containing protein [Pararhizobium sp.]MDO9414791.1 Kazal-type serine protease inhibitor domain-containing protein [Pararhizobium sp.]